MQLPDIDFKYKEFEEYALSYDAYMYDRTFYIDNRGKDVKIVSDTYEEYFAKVQIKLAEQSDTIKVEGIEQICGWKDGTIHAFRYWPNSPSFPEHTDPVDVILEVHEGSKTIEVDGKIHNLDKFDPVLVIPANTPHRALNDKEGIMLSYGLSDTESPADLHQNNGDL